MESWVIEWLSAERLQRYVIAAGHDHGRTLHLYEWNANLNSALLHDFAHFEIAIRNLYDRGLLRSLQQGEAHWLESSPLLRLYPAPSKGNQRTRSDIAKARNRLSGSHAPPGAIMAELTFGFWAMMTAQRLETTVWPYLKQVFPPQTDRAQSHDSMMELNKTRNRVAHHEPAQPGNVRLTLRRMRRIARYVSPEFAGYLRSTSNVQSILAARP